MKGSDLVYVKFNYEEGLESKKILLSSEMSLLRILKIIKKYHLLRAKELKLKLKMHKNMKETSAKIKSLQKKLPKVKISKKPKKEQEMFEIAKTKEEKYDFDLEKQLEEIQEKLKSLEN